MVSAIGEVWLSSKEISSMTKAGPWPCQLAEIEPIAKFTSKRSYKNASMSSL